MNVGQDGAAEAAAAAAAEESLQPLLTVGCYRWYRRRILIIRLCGIVYNSSINVVLIG